MRRLFIVLAVLLWAAPASAVFVDDTFTGTDADKLDVHTGETGATWTVVGTANRGEIRANRLRFSNSGLYYASGTPAGTEYDIEVDYYCISVAAWQAFGGRYNSATTSGYYARSNAGNWELRKKVNNTDSTLGTYAQTLSAGVNYALRLELRDGSQKLFVDGVERISTTDSDAALTGAGAVWVYGPFQSATGSYHISRIWATDYAAGGGSSIKTVLGVAKASVKTVNGLAIGSVKTINGLP